MEGKEAVDMGGIEDDDDGESLGWRICLRSLLMSFVG